MARINEKLGGYMLETGASRQAIAEQLGLDPRSLKARVDGETEWKLSELGRIAELIGISLDDLVKEDA